MTEREQIKEIIDRLPDYKMKNLLLIMKGIQLDDEIEDDLYCQKLVDDYMNDPDPEKNETISIEELARQEGIVL